VGPTCQRGERGQGNDLGLSPGGSWAEREPLAFLSLFFVPFLFPFSVFFISFAK
jgi:hypothetical protein